MIITGDIHSSWVNDIRADPVDAASPVVATELVGTSISSSFPTGVLVDLAEAPPRPPRPSATSSPGDAGTSSARSRLTTSPRTSGT